MSSNLSAAYVEGNYAGGGWSYRINRVTKTGGRVIYSALLTHEESAPNSETLYLWLAEFDSLDEARTAARQVLRQWNSLTHPAL